MPFGCDFDSSISDVYSLRLLSTVYSRQNNQWPQNPSELKAQQSMNLSYFEIRFTSKNISYYCIIQYNLMSFHYTQSLHKNFIKAEMDQYESD